MDVVERRARIGIELIDALTGGPVATSSRVVVGEAEVLRANTSRWFVEDALPPLAQVDIEADGYLAESLTVAVPPAGAPGAFLEVRLKPRTGYPFPPSLTRVVGMIVFDQGGAPAAGVAVTVTPRHGGNDGAAVATRTTDDGQFAMWFLPMPGGVTPPLADGFRVDAQIVVDGTPFNASLPPQPLVANRRNDAPVLRLTP